MAMKQIKQNKDIVNLVYEITYTLNGESKLRFIRDYNTFLAQLDLLDEFNATDVFARAIFYYSDGSVTFNPINFNTWK